MEYFQKMKGGNETAASISVSEAVISGGGGLLAIAVVGSLTVMCGLPLLMAPFGASCVLAFAVHKGPLSQPRAIIGGHMISTLIGLAVQQLFGNDWRSVALAVGLAITGMIITKTIHPPAGADPIVVVAEQVGWTFLFYPVLTGSISIVLVALFYNNLFRGRKYPQFW